MLDRITSINKIGLMLMVMAAVIGYRSKSLAKKLLKCAPDKLEQYSITLKLVAIFMAMLGMLKIFGKI